METFISKYGSTITKMTAQETCLELNNGCSKYREISALMKFHNMTEEQALEQYNKNQLFAEEMGW